MAGPKKFDVPELTYNLDLLVEMTEEEIIRNNRQLNFLKVQLLAHMILTLKNPSDIISLRGLYVLVL